MIVNQTPSVGRIVHYVARGSADGMFAAEVCRAAIVTDASPGLLPPAEGYADRELDTANTVLGLCVLNPTGMIFQNCPQDEDVKAGGTWHWPERV